MSPAEIASTGQSAAQEPQAMQASVILYAIVDAPPFLFCVYILTLLSRNFKCFLLTVLLFITNVARALAKAAHNTVIYQLCSFT